MLATKPHQEHINDINKFIWKMCISYHSISKVTRIYEYPIPRCDMAITIFQMVSSKMYIITVDTKQGYHQVIFRTCDIEKLEFFASNHKKYAFKVMHFGSVNTPTFYTCTMGDFRVEWYALFIECMTTLVTSGVKLGNKISSINYDTIFLGDQKLTSSTRSSIDDILIWSSDIPTILLYLECVCRVFQK